MNKPKSEYRIVGTLDKKIGNYEVYSYTIDEILFDGELEMVSKSNDSISIFLREYLSVPGPKDLTDSRIYLNEKLNNKLKALRYIINEYEKALELSIIYNEFETIEEPSSILVSKTIEELNRNVSVFTPPTDDEVVGWTNVKYY